eukprot:SAG11_NODE_312_length_10890_cov_44.733043_7_plen_234_part_00
MGNAEAQFSTQACLIQHVLLSRCPIGTLLTFKSVSCSCNSRSSSRNRIHTKGLPKDLHSYVPSRTKTKIKFYMQPQANGYFSTRVLHSISQAAAFTKNRSVAIAAWLWGGARPCARSRKHYFFLRRRARLRLPTPLAIARPSSPACHGALSWQTAAPTQCSMELHKAIGATKLNGADRVMVRTRARTIELFAHHKFFGKGCNCGQHYHGSAYSRIEIDGSGFTHQHGCAQGNH